jgi:hypothetical protein
MCCREPNLPLRHVLQQVKLAHGAEFSVNVTIVACFFFSQPFRLHCFDKYNLHTSSSKNPERSRADAIPIN